MTYVIGLTGGIGTGKSLCTKILAEKGITVIDADSVGHLVLLPGGEAYDSVVANFGCVLPDGKIDRAALGKIVFSDPEKLALLNSITHPAIRLRIEKMIRAAKGIVLLECALLFESGFDMMADEIWLVTAQETIREERIMKRNNLPREGAKARIAAQSDYNEYIPKCRVILENNGTAEEFSHKVEAAYLNLLERTNYENV